MASNQRRLILGNGEAYVQRFEKKFNARPPVPPRTFDEARALLKAAINTSLDAFENLDATKKIEDEAVFCLRLHPDVTAKSYSPEAIFSKVPELRSIGSRIYRVGAEEVAQTKRVKKQVGDGAERFDARMLFVQSSPDGFRRLDRFLDLRESQQTKEFRREICRVENLDVLRAEEQLVGFGDRWKEGRVELVIHPFRTTDEAQQEFLFELFDQAGIDRETATVRPYAGGPTFVSCRASKAALGRLAGANPLRSAHPLRFGGLKKLRNAPKANGPKPPSSTTRSTIKVGVFDGGIDPFAPLLRGHAEEDEELSIGTPAELDYLEHGTAVAGAVLHGSLTSYGPKDRLPTPPVYVVSFRVFPASNPDDVDLYEAIDLVENAVPSRPDIKVFNLSFGPEGPIDDDPVSRFTYVLDSLAVAHKVTFCVAVGNDGDVEGESRIQSPSDLVHGLGVGAYTLEGDRVVHADYSCHGPGRECGKIKPDVTAFGGCEVRPTHLVSVDPNQKVLDWGTSYAAPIASALTAQAAESFERSSALLGRALMVHTASHPDGDPDHLLGHGVIERSIDEVLLCDEHSVTVVFQGGLVPKQVVRLPIPWTGKQEVSGTVDITWTIAALSGIDPSHPGDYTSCCLEDTFYPNESKFRFSAPSDWTGRPKQRILHVEKDKDEAESLIAQGWKCSHTPVSDSGNQYRDELSRRKLDCKWESIVRRYKPNKPGKGIERPFLTLHAIGRNGASQRFDYAVAVTLRAKTFSGDLYTVVRNEFPALAPIRLRTEAETRIQIA